MIYWIKQQNHVITQNKLLGSQRTVDSLVSPSIEDYRLFHRMKRSDTTCQHERPLQKHQRPNAIHPLCENLAASL